MNWLCVKDEIETNCGLKIETLDGSSGIYFLLHKGVVVYIGQSNNLMARVYAHKIDKKFDTIKYVIVSDRHVRLNLERALIKKYKPLYNQEFVTIRTGLNKNKPKQFRIYKPKHNWAVEPYRKLKEGYSL